MNAPPNFSHRLTPAHLLAIEALPAKWWSGRWTGRSSSIRANLLCHRWWRWLSDRRAARADGVFSGSSTAAAGGGE